MDHFLKSVIMLVGFFGCLFFRRWTTEQEWKKGWSKAQQSKKHIFPWILKFEGIRNISNQFDLGNWPIKSYPPRTCTVSPDSNFMWVKLLEPPNAARKKRSSRPSNRFMRSAECVVFWLRFHIGWEKLGAFRRFVWWSCDMLTHIVIILDIL